MRLGEYSCRFYGCTKGTGHRYEFNNEYRKYLEDFSLKIVGVGEENSLVEIVELLDHCWFIGDGFHPEFKSRPNRAHTLFYDFVRVSYKNKKSVKKDVG